MDHGEVYRLVEQLRTEFAELKTLVTRHGIADLVRQVQQLQEQVNRMAALDLLSPELPPATAPAARALDALEAHGVTAEQIGAMQEIASSLASSVPPELLEAVGKGIDGIVREVMARIPPETLDTLKGLVDSFVSSVSGESDEPTMPGAGPPVAIWPDNSGPEPAAPAGG
jgi:hypothetical protein